MQGFASVLKAFRVRASAESAPIYPDVNGTGLNGDLSCDEMGNLWVRMAAGPGSGSNRLQYRAVPGIDAAVMGGPSITGKPALLTQFGGFNDSSAAIYVQLFDTDSLPNLGDAPVMCFYVPAGQSFVWEPSNGGFPFFMAVTFAVSSTRDTYTPDPTTIFAFAEGQNS